MKKRIEVENVVVGGRRPHGILLFIDDERQPREIRAAPTRAALGCLGFQLVYVIRPIRR